MAQQSRTQSSFPEDQASIPSTHMAAYNCLKLQFSGIEHLHSGINAGKTPMHINGKKIVEMGENVDIES